MGEEQGSVEQFELPVSVGDRLRAAREELGLTLEYVSAETKISERHLAQIEAGDFESTDDRGPRPEEPRQPRLF